MSGQALDGGAFVLDAATEPRSVWGSGVESLWSCGEPLVLAGPPGCGKSTLVQQVALRRAGVLDGALLDLPVTRSDGRTLLVAADRPAQQARSMRRMVGDKLRTALESGLVVWRGALPFELTAPDAPKALCEFVAGFEDVETVVLDSLGAVAVGLSGDEEGGRVARALQALVTEGCEVACVHHTRKATSENRVPRRLDDVYGSRWLSAVAGSVIGLWAEPGDPVVAFRHLKQPAEEVGPFDVLHDHTKGASTVFESVSLRDVLRASRGLTARQAAARLFGRSEPTRSEVEKVRRKLDRLYDQGQANRDGGGQGRHAVYTAIDGRYA